MNPARRHALAAALACLVVAASTFPAPRPIAAGDTAAVDGTPTPGPTTTPAQTATPVPTPTPTPVPSIRPVTYRLTRFAIATLPVGQRPYDDVATPSLATVPANADATGVPLSLVGGRLVYNPVTVARWAIANLEGYERTADPEYLRRARAAADVFRRVGVRVGGALYLPYTYDFALHGIRTEVLHAKWYSAMAQGQALTLLSRLYALGHDPADLATARQLFGSFQHIGRGTAPWVSWIDASRYLWLEEYAEPHPEHTLNGFVFAVYGLYDYFAVTRDPNALNLLRGSLTTLKANVIRYRNVGHVSAYCLEHRTRSLKYHHIHVAQMAMLGRMTGDPYFSWVSRAFRRDAW